MFDLFVGSFSTVVKKFLSLCYEDTLTSEYFNFLSRFYDSCQFITDYKSESGTLSSLLESKVVMLQHNFFETLFNHLMHILTPDSSTSSKLFCVKELRPKRSSVISRGGHEKDLCCFAKSNWLALLS